jgi:DNA mismatch endonuclease (patch repair protein)
MSDVVDSRTRSRMMGAVRSRDTAPELRVRKYLHGCGLRYRVHVGNLPGCPDLVFPRYKVIVFVHGCFWHQHSGCRKASLPTANREFWTQKLEGNVRRDAAIISNLEQAGWRVLVIWECQTRDEDQLRTLYSSIRENADHRNPTGIRITGGCTG